MIDDDIYLEAMRADHDSQSYAYEPSDEEILDLLAAIKGSN